MDIWIRFSHENAVLTAEALEEFGYAKKDQSLAVLLQFGKILRMGFPPFRLEVSTSIDGVTFDECYANHVVVTVDHISITLIGYEDLLTNKRAAGRLKDLLDVQELVDRNN